MAKILVARLSKQGYETILACEGVQGVEFAHKKKPDLIILDLKMPAGDGLFVLRNLKQSVNTRFIPVVVFTSQSDEEVKRKVVEIGVEAYLEKSCEAETLLKTIQDILQE